MLPVLLSICHYEFMQLLVNSKITIIPFAREMCTGMSANCMRPFYCNRKGIPFLQHLAHSSVNKLHHCAQVLDLLVRHVKL